MALNETLIKIIKKCQNSPQFFIENFCKIQHPKLGIIKFKLFSYQKKSIKWFMSHRLNLFHKVRQSGVSTLSGSFALWYAMFYNNKTILIVSKRDEDAKDFLRKNIQIPYNNLPQWMKDLWVLDGKPTDHRIAFKNGSRITSLTSSPDTLRSHASSLNIIDEAAFMKDMSTMWCVAPGTIVYSNNGFSNIEDINAGDMVKGTNNEKCIKTHYKKNSRVLTIKTKRGLSITCGEKHWLKFENNWLRADKLSIGDKLTVSAGFANYDKLEYVKLNGSIVLDEREAELLGLFYTYDTITEDILKSPKKVVCSFLRGLFETDGWCYTDNNKIEQINLGFGTSSEVLAIQVQNLLLGYGIRSYLNEVDGLYKIEITIKADMAKFRDEIGCMSQDRLDVLNMIDDNHLYDNDKYDFADEIVSITDGISEVYDLTLTGDHSYISNGFYSHNSGGWPTLQTGGCIYKDSLILTKSGIMRIDDIGNINNEDQWQNIDVDVVTDNGYAKANKFYINNNGNKSKTIEISTKLGYNIGMSYDHKIRVIANDEYKWKLSTEIEPGDIIPIFVGGYPDDILDKKLETIPSHNDNIPDLSKFKNNHSISIKCAGCDNTKNVKTITLKKRIRRRKDRIYYCNSCGCKYSDNIGNNIVLPNKIEPWFAEWLGLYMGDGSMTSYRIGISCNSKDGQLIDYISKIYTEKFKVKPRLCSHKNATSVIIGGTKLIRYMQYNKLCKDDASNAFIPKQILSGSRESICAFIRGIFESDGSVSAHKKCSLISFSSISKRLTTELHTLLLSIGIVSTLKKYENMPGHFGTNPIYKISISKKSQMLKFRELIGFISDRKNEKLNNIKIMNHKLADLEQTKIIKNFQFCNKDKFYYDKVDSIDFSNKETYDISVPDGNTYISNGFVSHNSCIVISTPKGVGNWYYNKVMDAMEGKSEFNLIHIRWWDMDWRIKFTDELSGRDKVIAPLAGIKKCTDPEDIKKYGPYWSPWLEEQYQELTERGDDSKFRQEILSDFIGSGSTVIPRDSLAIMSATVDDNFQKISNVEYKNSDTNEIEILDFCNDLWVWKPPYRGMPNNPKDKPHIYSMGVDVGTGESDDYSAVVVWDITTREQVAELHIKALPRVFCKMIDYLGRWYNNAHVIVDRTGIGASVCQDLFYQYHYPNMYREQRQRVSLRMQKTFVGYNISNSEKKAALNKELIDNLGEDGFTVYSTRFNKEAHIYIRLTATKTGNEPGPGNHDDIVIAGGLGLIGVTQAVESSDVSLIPIHNSAAVNHNPAKNKASDVNFEELTARGVIMPLYSSSELQLENETPEAQLKKFSSQIGGIPIEDRKSTINVVSNKKKNPYNK